MVGDKAIRAMREKLRNAVSAVAFGVAAAGGAYVVWAVFNAVLGASPLTQFLIGTAAASTGGMATYVSIRR